MDGQDPIAVEPAMRLLQKSMGPKPLVSLSNEDLRQLLKYFDGLPPNHHKIAAPWSDDAGGDLR